MGLKLHVQSAMVCSFNVCSFTCLLPLCRVELHWCGRSGFWKIQTPWRRPSASVRRSCTWHKPSAALFGRTVSVTEIQIKMFKRGCFIHLLICLSILSRNIVTYIKLTTEKLPENSEGDAVKVKVVLNGKRLCQIFSITSNVCLRALCWGVWNILENVQTNSARGCTYCMAWVSEPGSPLTGTATGWRLSCCSRVLTPLSRQKDTKHTELGTSLWTSCQGSRGVFTAHVVSQPLDEPQFARISHDQNSGSCSWTFCFLSASSPSLFPCLLLWGLHKEIKISKISFYCYCSYSVKIMTLNYDWNLCL